MGMEPGLGDVPVGCLACMLGLLSPREIARLALVNKTFLEASRLDVVWKRRLPPHWQDILPGNIGPTSAMDLYHKLSMGVFVEDQEKDKQKIYWIDRPTGGVCNMLSSRALRIERGDNDRSWDWRTMAGSRFDEVAFLRAVSWLEIQGQFRGYLRPGNYTVSFRLKLLPSHERRRGRGDAYGWEVKPVVFSVSAPPAPVREYRRYLLHINQNGIGVDELADARVVADGWTEVDAGVFSVDDEDCPVTVQFSLQEVRGGNWKSGLYVDGAVIKPTFLVSSTSSESRGESSEPVIEDEDTSTSGEDDVFRRSYYVNREYPRWTYPG